jgi:hypothetical protein
VTLWALSLLCLSCGHVPLRKRTVYPCWKTSYGERAGPYSTTWSVKQLAELFSAEIQPLINIWLRSKFMSKYLGHQKTSENQQKKICLSICRKRHVFSSSLSFLVSQFTLRHFLLQDVRRYGVKVETQDQMQIDWSCWMWQCVVTVQKDAETSNLNENGDKYHCSASFWGYHRLYCAPHIWFLGTSQCQSQRVIDPPGSFRNDVLVVLPHNLSIFVLLPLFWGGFEGSG